MLPGAPELLIGGLFWAGIPLIVSIYVAGKRGLALVPAIILALVGGLFGAIIVILFYKPGVVEPTPPSTAGLDLDADPSARLQKLKDLLDDALISPEEYERKRAEVLQSL